jgi:hypothetical protein
MLSGRMCDRLTQARRQLEGYKELMRGVSRRTPAGKLLYSRLLEAEDHVSMLLQEAYQEEMGDKIVWLDHTCRNCRRDHYHRDDDLRPCGGRRRDTRSE